MSNCKNVCKLCRKLIISSSVTWNGTNLIVTLPAGCYDNDTKYCIVIAQSIPSATTVNAQVLIQIGTGTQTYPLLKRNCRPMLAKNLNTRTKYSVCVETTPTSGVFRLLGDVCCCSDSNLASINGTAPVTAATTNEVVLSTTKGAKSNAQ